MLLGQGGQRRPLKKEGCRIPTVQRIGLPVGDYVGKKEKRDVLEKGKKGDEPAHLTSGGSTWKRGASAFYELHGRKENHLVKVCTLATLSVLGEKKAKGNLLWAARALGVRKTGGKEKDP